MRQISFLPRHHQRDEALEQVEESKGTRGVGDDGVHVRRPDEADGNEQDEQVGVADRKLVVGDVLEESARAEIVGHSGAELAPDRGDGQQQEAHEAVEGALRITGTGRDLDQVAGLNFPVFTNGACCSHGNCAILSANVPVTVGGLTVFPGDLLHGDRNGVTTIPLEIASEIPDACTEFMVAEQFVLNYVRSGNPTAQGFAAARAEMAHAIDALKQRIRRTP